MKYWMMNWKKKKQKRFNQNKTNWNLKSMKYWMMNWKKKAKRFNQNKTNWNLKKKKRE
jgi:hypothetical protein